MPLLKPPGLQPGDTIGFFSPSSAATAWAPHRFEHAIMSVIGGSNSNSLLPYLDYEALRRDP